MNDSGSSRIHWSFWAIGAAGLIFNGLGCANFLSQMNTAAVSSMPEIYRAIVESRPAWGTAAFALAVFGGLLGCALLLLRRSLAFHAFVVSVAGAVVAQIPFLGMADFPVAAWVGWLSQVVAGSFLAWFARFAVSRNWIR